jgi:hypothetical protein
MKPRSAGHLHVRATVVDMTPLKYMLVGIGCLAIITELFFLCFPDGRAVINKTLGINKLDLSPRQEKYLRWHKLVWGSAIASLAVLFVLRHVLSAI